MTKKTGYTITTAAAHQEFNKLVGDFLKKAIALDRMEKVCYGVTLSQCHLLESLNRKGLKTMQELSRDLNIKVSTLTRNLDILAREGIITRTRGEQDRRQVYVQLTEAGLDLQKKLEKCSLAFTGEILSRIPQSRRAYVFESFQILNNVIQDLMGNCFTPDAIRKEKSKWKKKAAANHRLILRLVKGIQRIIRKYRLQPGATPLPAKEFLRVGWVTLTRLAHPLVIFR